MDDGYLRALQKTIRDLHGAESIWMRTAAVVQMFQGKPVWEGSVERFAIKGHPTAQECFAWGYPVDGTNRTEYVAVLREPPIDSPSDAVGAYIAGEYHKGRVR